MSFDENPTIVELKENIKGLKQLLESPVKYLLSRNDRRIKTEELEDLETKLYQQVCFADRYNELFSKYGWIVHESLDVEKIVEAVNKFDENGLESAEELIKSYYKQKFKKLKRVIFNSKYFYSRKRLFELAYDDYLSERYHSSIPMMLMLVDGVLNDLLLKGFAVSNADYEVWDSISGHSSGLNIISQIYNKTVRKTNENQLELPYRNGILHGRELNYDNETLAIKTNALVIYIFDWVRSYESENHRKEEYKKRHNTSFSFKDVLTHRAEMQKLDTMQLEWNEKKIPEVTYSKSQLDELVEGTPEQEFMNFITNLNKKQYGKNFQKIPLIVREGHTEGYLAGQMRKSFEEFLPINVEELYINNRGSATSTIKAKLNYNSPYSSDELINREVVFHLVYENHLGKPVNRLTNSGQWVIMQIFGKEFEMK